MGVSQLELSLRSGISQRHLGFIEIGRARPTRSTLLRVLEELGSSQSLINAALLHAGYSADGAGDGATAEQVDIAVRKMMEAHFPFPACAFDASWHFRLMSPGAKWLFAQVMPSFVADDTRPIDMISAIAAREGVLSNVKNPEIAASVLLSQMYAEAWATPSLRDRVEQCAKALTGRFGQLPEISLEAASPSFTITFETLHGDLSFFSVQTVPGFPQNVSVDSVRLELSYPADARTREIMMREVGADEADCDERELVSVT